MSVQLATAPSHPVFVECASCTINGGEEDQIYPSRKSDGDSASLKDSGSILMSETSTAAGSGPDRDTSRAMGSSFSTILLKRQYLPTAWPTKHFGAQDLSTMLCTDAITHHAAIPSISTMARSHKILWTLFGLEQQPSSARITHGQEEKPMVWRNSQNRACARFATGIRTKESVSSDLPKNMAWPKLKSATSSFARRGGTSSNRSGVIISLL